jgi:energy-coupling factor transporter ATP-binding protein EcfA2
MVFQDESAFPWRSVIDNVAFPLELAGLPKRERHEQARRFVSMVGLDGFERRFPAELSGGMRQRVAIARTLASQPRILLMDEPFAALDEQTRLLLGDKVLQIHQQLRQTTLLITHNITEAVQLSDRVLVMTYRPGRLKKRVRHRPTAAADVLSRRQRRVRPLCRANLERPARGSESRHSRRRVEAAQPRGAPMTRRLPAYAAPALGVATLVAVFALLEVLIRAGAINRFVVPLPSQVIAAIPRIVVEEDIPHRFWQTTQEALWASVMLVVAGVGVGMLMFRFRPLRSACETWVAALASAPVVLMYPLFLVIFGRSATTIVMIGFAAGLPPVILKTVEGLAGTRNVLPTSAAASVSTTGSSSGRSCCRPRCRASSSACASDSSSR